jgi:hypothetical protein
MEEIHEHGCIACRMHGIGNVWPEIHHLTSTGQHGNGARVGHDATVGLCSWHHRGIVFDGHAVETCDAIRGPSLAHTPRSFRATYGRDEKLLAYQNRLLGESHRATA